MGEFTGELEARVDEDGFALAEREGFPGQRRVSSVIYKQNMQIKVDPETANICISFSIS